MLDYRLRRREAIFALAALPAAAQQASDSFPVITTVAQESASAGKTRFFTAAEMATLTKLTGLLVPKSEQGPGALEAGVPAFLDFYISASPKDRQELYRAGLKNLAGLNDGNAAQMLASLRQPWTYNGPSDVTGQFLRAVKADSLQATVNSWEWAQATQARSRGGARTSFYWKALD